MKDKLLTLTLSTEEWKHIIGSLDVDYSEVSDCDPAELSNGIIYRVLPRLYEIDKDLPEAWIKYVKNNPPSVKEVLLYLDKIGWSNLIDERWTKKVVNDIKEEYPNITEDILNKVLDIIIIK